MAGQFDLIDERAEKFSQLDLEPWITTQSHFKARFYLSYYGQNVLGYSYLLVKCRSGFCINCMICIW